ncbi:MAG: S8 family serine peptidase, partial [Anaerolineales bacterium]
VGGCDFVNRDDTAQDDNGHGTHVAGIAAAASNNGIGIAGVSWGARVMPVKVLSASGSGSYQDVASGIIWAADNGANVINLSLGGSSPSGVLENAVNYATNRGVLVVASAGNSGNSTPNYPAAYANAFAVAATDSSNNRASFSTFGGFVDIAAPGVSIYSTYFDDTYASLSGTSMSAPHVSGAAALLYSYSQYLDTAAEIRTALESTALDLGSAGWDQYYGHGLIQLHAALLFDPTNVTPTPTPQPSPTPTNTPIPQSYYYVRSDACGSNFSYNWIDATDGSNLNLRYDDYYASVILPFDFFFNGQSFRNIYVSTNGFISFETSGAATYLNRAIPDATAPNEIIAPFWDDLNPYFAGDIFVKTLGSAPNRKFVVQWNNVPHYSQEGAHTFEAVLYEGSNEIVFQYGAMSGAYADGNSATIGLEFAGGTAGSQFSYNAAGAVYDGLALKFAVASGATPTPQPVCSPTPTPTNTPTPTPTPIICYTLTLAVGPTSGGNINASPSPNCNGGAQYVSGTVVQLTANAASNYYRFNSWSGAATGTTNPVSVTMNGNKSVTANFDQATFGDVPFDHPQYRYIQAIYNGGFTAGCSSSPLLYCPDTILQRAQSAVFVLRGQFGTNYSPPTSSGTFSDDWSKGTWAEKWAEGMWGAKLTAGCNTSPRQYCPWQDHTRTEASVFYLRMKHGSSYAPPAPTGLFADVDLNWWGAKWAEQAYRDELLPACGTNPSGQLLFCPNDLLTRAWAAYMMVQAKSLPLPP